MKKHLAIFKDRIGELILNGEKVIETRFSIAKIAPYGQVESGDLVYIKPSGKEIIGQFRVKKVVFIDKANGKYATLIFVGQTERFLTAPIKIHKKDLRGWVVLG